MSGWQKALANSYGVVGVEINVHIRKARKAGNSVSFMVSNPMASFIAHMDRQDNEMEKRR